MSLVYAKKSDETSAKSKLNDCTVNLICLFGSIFPLSPDCILIPTHVQSYSNESNCCFPLRYVFHCCVGFFSLSCTYIWVGFVRGGRQPYHIVHLLVWYSMYTPLYVCKNSILELARYVPLVGYDIWYHIYHTFSYLYHTTVQRGLRL